MTPFELYLAEHCYGQPYLYSENVVATLSELYKEYCSFCMLTTQKPATSKEFEKLLIAEKFTLVYGKDGTVQVLFSCEY